MLEYFKSRIPNVSKSDLLALAQDAERRIGSHLAGGNPLNEYVQRQIAILELIQEELERR
jgi:hypothetical protein